MALIETTSDADLVAACLAGNRSAFEQIVERYQRLLCSLAYSGTGNIAESEDVAQETFLTAWMKLGELREPEKLRPWLCGILRFKISHARRRGGLEPVSGAAELDEAHDISSGDEPVGDAAIAAEEQAILWHALEQLPENYREPLVLYYREHRSVEHVAVELDLTEDTVKQRLSRGRKMLKEQALAFVEGALSRSTPGKVFTAAVIAALPAMAPTTAKAAGTGGVAWAAAKGAGGVAKTTLLAAILASVSGVVSTVMTLRMNLDQARTKRERRAVVRMTVSLFGSFFVFIAGLVAWVFWMGPRPEHHGWAVPLHHVMIVGFAIGWSVLIVRSMREIAELRTAERAREPAAFKDPRDRIGAKAAEYKSERTFLGVPLVHIRFAAAESGQPPVFGWIAGGDRAIGILFAWGGWAVGLFSGGAVSFGLVSFGAVSVGAIGLGAIAFGGLALGSVTMGYHAIASVSASAWSTAQSAMVAISHWVAGGKFAIGPHANDELVGQVLANPDAQRDGLIFCVVMILLTLVPTAVYARAVRRRMKLN